MKFDTHKAEAEPFTVKGGKDRNDRALQLIDLHLHAGWTDFDHAVQEQRTYEEQKKRIEDFLKGYREQGIVLARDAGGFDKNTKSADSTAVLGNCGMLGAEGSHEDLQIIDNAEKSPCSWVKIFVTDGVGRSPEEVLMPKCSKEYFSGLVRYLHGKNKRIMVHCYGGTALDWCIEERVDTVEHAVYMTREQAEKIAENKIAVVPTTSVYRLLSEKPEIFGIPDFIRENAKHAAEAQLKSVKYALEAGACIGYGTDFYSDPALLPYARYELSTLCDCGLNNAQALAAGTVNAEIILGR